MDESDMTNHMVKDNQNQDELWDPEASTMQSKGGGNDIIASKDEINKREKENLSNNVFEAGLTKQQNSRYLINETKCNMFYTVKKLLVEIIIYEQNHVYGSNINHLKDPSIKLKPATILDQHCTSLLNRNKLCLKKQDDILLYQDRTVIPPKLRVAILQHIHVERLQHKG